MENKEPFNSRSLFAILLCVTIWWGWQQYLQNKYPETLNPTPAQVAEPMTQEPTNEMKAAILISKPTTPEKTWDFDSDNIKYVISSHGGRISQIILKKYLGKDNKQAVELLSKDAPGFLLVSSDKSPNLAQIDYQINPISKSEVELIGEYEGLKIKKALTFQPEKYAVGAKILISGNTAGVGKINVDVVESAPKDGGSSSVSSFLTFGQSPEEDLLEYFASHATKSSRDHVPFKEDFRKNYEQTHLASVGSRYFTALLFNRSNVLPEGQALREGSSAALRMSYPVLDHSASISINLDLYTGPKLMDQLRQFDEGATAVIDYGYFAWIALPLLQIMKWFYGIFGNYGVAIIALTILVRALTFPFTYVSFKSMKSMQKIQPEIARLKEIYKDNTQALNVEMMKLMKENKVNPMGGCLPLLLQLPVFWALYQVLQNSIELYHSPFAGWIHDLSQKDPYYVLPVLMGVTMFIQQKITPNTMDPAQARILLIMPIFFSFLMFGLPSGLTLYIFVSTLFGILQQMFMMQDRKGQSHGQAVVRRA